jgi:hypothetical protein
VRVQHAWGGPFAVLVISTPLLAGSYAHTAECDTTSGCSVGHPTSATGNNINPQSVVHAKVFQQAGGNLTLAVCTDALPGSGLSEAVSWAIEVWSALAARTENCFNCATWEEGAPPGSAGHKPVLATTVLHEFGHCALGLDHPDRNWDVSNDGTYEATSFTRSWNAQPNGIQDGVDDIRGSYDDTQQAAFGQLAESVSWFRKTDNDPIVVDSTIIDTSTYSRSVASNLPSGHTWAANANRAVAESLGHPTTQAVMYAAAAAGLLYNGLSADDVSMVKMARAGADLTAATGDDYTLQFSLVSCAGTYDLAVRFVPLPIGVFGQCWSSADYAYAQNPALARVFKLVPNDQKDASHLVIEINSNYTWELGLPVFADGFESANSAAWTQTVP